MTPPGTGGEGSYAKAKTLTTGVVDFPLGHSLHLYLGIGIVTASGRWSTSSVDTSYPVSAVL